MHEVRNDSKSTVLGDYIRFSDESCIYVDGYCLREDEAVFVAQAELENIAIRYLKGHSCFPLAWMMSVDALYANVDCEQLEDLFSTVKFEQ